MKLVSIVAVAFAMALGGVAQAQAKTSKVPGTKVSRDTGSKDYVTSSYSYSGGSYTHEITTNLSGGQYISEKACKDCSTASILNLKGSYLHYWQDNMQWGVEGAVNMLSKEVSRSGKSETLVDLLAIGAYNLDSDFKNSIFAKAGVGIYSVLNDRADGYENKLGLFLGVGKRFSWLSNVSYTPELRLVKKGDIDFGLEIALINFSIYW